MAVLTANVPQKTLEDLRINADPTYVEGVDYKVDEGGAVTATFASRAEANQFEAWLTDRGYYDIVVKETSRGVNVWAC